MVDGKELTWEVPVVGAVLQHGPLQLELRVGGGLRGHGLGLGVGEVLVLGYGGQAQWGLRGVLQLYRLYCWVVHVLAVKVWGWLRLWLT